MKKINFVLLLGLVLFHRTVFAAVGLNDVVKIDSNCEQISWGNTLQCGKLSGRLNTLYYSTHDAFFIHQLNQDTATTGGFIRYETAVMDGLQAGVSYAGQWRLDDQDAAHDEVPELSQEKDGLAEAWIGFRNQNWAAKIGQQSLDVPFLGQYDWRVMPPLYRAIDVQYGQDQDYIRATYLDRFKSYADDQFLKTSRYSSELETEGMWSFGFAKHFDLDKKQLKTQAWVQSYFDYTDVAYMEAHLQWNQMKYKPDVGIQMMYARDQGDAKAGQIDHQGIGVSLAFNDIWERFSLKTGYNYIQPNKDSYLNGALFVPYMIYTASGPYFAQPFFTSTQDLGSGHAFMFALEGALNEQTWLGANYSFMNLAESDQVKDLNQSEYVIYGIYNFAGWLKGWSVANFFGFATSPRSDDIFVQNRFGLKYSF